LDKKGARKKWASKLPNCSKLVGRIRTKKIKKERGKRDQKGVLGSERANENGSARKGKTNPS